MGKASADRAGVQRRRGPLSGYFLFLRRRAAAMPARPVASSVIDAGSGTVVCVALRIWPVIATSLPGLTETSFTEKVNVPFDVPLLNVKVRGALSKLKSTPPLFVLLTLPVSSAENVVGLPPVMPGGAVNVTCSWNVL